MTRREVEDIANVLGNTDEYIFAYWVGESSGISGRDKQMEHITGPRASMLE
ncbi:Hypothetical predicted protein, partial [Olea europaea subsp. europaea]